VTCVGIGSLWTGLPVGTVLGEAVQELCVSIASEVPAQPPVRAVVTAKAVLDLDRLESSGRQRGGAAKRFIAVVGMHQVDVRHRINLIDRVAQLAHPAGIDFESPTVESDDTRDVGGGLDDLSCGMIR